MSIEIIVPALGESVSEATIAKWHKKAGEVIKIDELLLELETEKVTLEVNASSEGVLESIAKQEDETVAVGEVVGMIAPGAKAQVSPKAADSNDDKNESSNKESKKDDFDTEEKSELVENMPPSVKKLISENDLDPSSISGTGKAGRINKGDVLEALANKDSKKDLKETSVSNINDDQEKPVERVRMSRLRKTIAQRLKDSQNTAAILTTFNEIDMSNVIKFRKNYRDDFQKKHDVKLGFMSFFVKAVINALKEVPSVNAEIDGEEIIYKYYYDIGVAVGTEQGLVVPVVKAADKMGFADIEKEIAALATKAREGKLSMTELTGGTFSITNGGVYGSLLSTPIINPPQTGIIGLHNSLEKPVAIDGKIEIRPMMYVALSYDHRIIDGKDAVTFLVKVKQSIENPERLLFDL